MLFPMSGVTGVLKWLDRSVVAGSSVDVAAVMVDVGSEGVVVGGVWVFVVDSALGFWNCGRQAQMGSFFSAGVHLVVGWTVHLADEQRGYPPPPRCLLT